MLIKTANTVLATLLLAGSCSARSTVSAKAKADFMRAMREAVDERDFKKERAMFKKQKKEKLRRNLLAKAIPVERKPANDEPEFMKLGKDKRAMKETLQKRRVEDAADNEDEAPEWGEFGFDVSGYSLKYIGCSAVSMYSEEVEGADDMDTVVQTTRFVTLRICNTSYCSNYLTNGCESDYGDYIIDMRDYLEAFAQYDEEVFEQYCFYCEQCMYFEKYFYGNRDLEDADADADGDADGDADVAADADADAAAGDADAAAGDADADANSESHACKYYDECKDYASTCGMEEEDEDADANANDDGYIEFEYQEFFECVEYNNGDDDGSAYYIGPMCQSDGFTISIGIFSDQLCTQYVGDSIDIVEATGIEFEEDGLANYYTNKCITCKESDLEYNVAAEDMEDEDDITELCEQVQMASAKCLENLEAEMYFEDEQEQEWNKEANQAKVCAFIESVGDGTYDEYGMIKIDQSRDSIFSYSYEDVGIGQIFALILGSFAIVVMITWSCLLHKALRNVQAGGWKPNSPTKPLNSAEESTSRDIDISRSNSGIMFARTDSVADTVKTEGDGYTGGVMS